ncbi:hypothetical protein LCGC14_2268080 [marine sediment metagenome]|uniref:Uncharacterized protein n=1 Tax=marine sediment metagenome TaxID=412755 RepID=A0A0F9CXT3_9ZZZZ
MTKPSQPDTDSSTRPELSQHTPICVPCQRNYRCERNGIFVRLGPDAIIDADLYQCPGCGHQIVRGFARRDVSRHDSDPKCRKVFGIQSCLMGSATITDNTGRPYDTPLVEWEARELKADHQDCIPWDDTLAVRR